MSITFGEISARIGQAQGLLGEALDERDGVRVGKACDVLEGLRHELVMAKMFLPAVTDPMLVALEKLDGYGRPASVDEGGPEPYPEDIDEAALEGALQTLRQAADAASEFAKAA